jgi:hypothetical protein
VDAEELEAEGSSTVDFTEVDDDYAVLGVLDDLTYSQEHVWLLGPVEITRRLNIVRFRQILSLQ